MAVLGGSNLKKVKDGNYVLQKNSPIHVSSQHKNVRFLLHEKDSNADEKIWITTSFTGTEYSFLGHEYSMPYLVDSKAADLLYIYVSAQENPSAAHCYVYDVKKTTGGEDMILHLIKQWDTTMYDAVSLAERLQCPIKKYIGIFTEEYNQNMLKYAIDYFRTNRQKRYDKLNLDFIERKRRAQTDVKDLEALRRFLNKKEAFVQNEWLPIDIRIIKNGEYHITFDGSKILPAN